MARRTRPSAVREKQIRERQEPMRWGKDYETGQRATVAEAPDESRPARVRCIEFDRPVHTMGTPETWALLVGLYVGQAKELHEGRMLPPEPGPGPLSGYPFAEVAQVRGYEGTIAVAERLGVFCHHPTVAVPANDGHRKRKTIAFPLLGDQLWFCEDMQGPYPVNLTIKRSTEDFERPFGSKRLAPQELAEAIDAQRARDAIEIELYRQAGVPTHHIAQTDIPEHVALNLRELYVWQHRVAHLEEELQSEVVETLRARMAREVPIFETLRYFLGKYGGTLYDYLVVLHQALWRREIEIDLWAPMNVDRPLRPAKQDAMKMFGRWFKRLEA